MLRLPACCTPTSEHLPPGGITSRDMCQQEEMGTRPLTWESGRYSGGDGRATLVGWPCDASVLCPRFLIRALKAGVPTSQGSFEDCIRQWA